ncbi:MAG: RpiB/LacA/LacB family sugar-phosphate isomerase, partial [Pelagibacteraceae bacterium]
NKINTQSIGILICGTGIGVSIAANRFKHIRASLCHNVHTAKLTRKHNNSNVICLQGRPFVKKNIFAMLNVYFKTEFEGGRHLRRVKQL